MSLYRDPDRMNTQNEQLPVGLHNSSPESLRDDLGNAVGVQVHKLDARIRSDRTPLLLRVSGHLSHIEFQLLNNRIENPLPLHGIKDFIWLIRSSPPSSCESSGFQWNGPA